MFGRPPSGGLLSSRGRGVDGSRGPPPFGAVPNVRAPFVRAVLVVLGAFGGRVRRTFSIRGAARQISSQTYVTNLVSSLASNLCASAFRPYPEMLPRLYRARLSLLPRMLPILRACDTLWSKMRGVLPEIRWFSSREGLSRAIPALWGEQPHRRVSIMPGHRLVDDRRSPPSFRYSFLR